MYCAPLRFLMFKWLGSGIETVELFNYALPGANRVNLHLSTQTFCRHLLLQEKCKYKPEQRKTDESQCDKLSLKSCVKLVYMNITLPNCYSCILRIH